ncbi:MAG: DJ-1/PfpI family protein [Nitrospinaceae bacterium]|jgi:putative intracellular protease/amidase|nr:MAG: DJ-1/PfpI family protein [Nitrospinaceae bacterium]
MGRLTGKNVLIIIPKDYYNEDELNIPLKKLREEDAHVLIASAKLKVAVGENGGHVTPDVLIVDAIEGITGDSYVSGTRGSRQVKAIFHGVIVAGGRGARSYLWKDKLVSILLNDRFRSGFVVGAIGMGTGCLASSGLAESQEIAAPNDKRLLKNIEDGKGVLSDEGMTSYNRILSARDSASAEKFTEAFIEEVAKTPFK